MLVYDTDKTLSQLENQVWDDPEPESSNLIKTCHKLRDKPLRDFDVEDLRILIGQHIGLDYLVPLAIERLKKNILAEGDYYEGDLLNNMLSIHPDYWHRNKAYWEIIHALVKKNWTLLEPLDTTEEIKKELPTSFKEFEKIR
jgi:hypothetical protein